MNTQAPMPPTPPVPPMPQLPPKQTNHTPWLIGCGVVFLLFFMALLGIGIYYGIKGASHFVETSNEAPQVQMATKLDSKTLEFIKKEKLLNGTEEPITYYDRWLDRTEISILTTERLIYYFNGSIMFISLHEIKDVKRQLKEDEFGEMDVFTIISQSGQKMKIEIDDFEGRDADIFERELDLARKAAKK